MAYINKVNLKKSFLYTFIIGFVAHGYAYANFQPSHDSLNEIISSSGIMEWKIQLGRYLKPVYDYVFGSFTSFPWSNGIFTLVWLSIAVYFMVEVLKVKKDSHIILISGILVTNVSVIALTATYEHDLGSDMCALAITMLGVYIWKKYTDRCLKISKKSILLLITIGVCTAVSMALYQAFISVFVTMILFISVLRCIDFEEWSLKKVWISDFFAAGATVVGGVIYYIGLKLVIHFTNITLKQENYNSVSNAWLNTEPFKERIVNCLKQFLDSFSKMPGYAYSSKIPQCINGLLLLFGVISLIFIFIYLIKKKVCFGYILSILFFLALLPFSMNIMRLLNTDVHALMMYAFWLSYIFVLILFVEYKKIQNIRYFDKLVLVLLSVVVLMNVQTANACYVKKTTEQKATLSLMTRVVDKIEDLDGYEAGVTPVAFIGLPSQYLKSYDPFNQIATITGMWDNSSITYYSIYNQYFKLIMRVNINVVSDSVAYETVGETFINSMPNFAKKDSICVKNGIVIVKFE